MKHLRIVALAVSLLALLTLAQSASAAKPPPFPCAGNDCTCKLSDVSFQYTATKQAPEFCGQYYPVEDDPDAFYKFTCRLVRKVKVGSYVGYEWSYKTFLCDQPQRR